MTKALILRAPEPLNIPSDMTKIFLGGSIEMGAAVDWQSELEEFLADWHVAVLNPRRKDWDSTWVQDPTPGTKFHEQVTWEQQAQEIADFRVYNFVPGTTSPITLLELGTYGADTYSDFDTIICCPKEYAHYGNVKLHADRYGIELVETFEELKLFLTKKLTCKPRDILDIPMNPEENDAEASTIGEYLQKLLETLWREDEGFSGKRPFGNSGWKYELYKPLAKYGLIEAVIDGYDDIIECDEISPDDLIYTAIGMMYKRNG